MSCSKGRASPDSNTKLRLFADSGGYCQNPGCTQSLFFDGDDSPLHIAEVAHILSASDIGPRSKRQLTKEQRNDYENLILLCPNCHTKVDKAEGEYPDSLLKSWKNDHQQKIANLFKAVEFPDRKTARAAIEPLFQENETIFKIYGPETEERHNPESDMPAIWRRKILIKIIPNNRRLVQIIDANRKFLLTEEIHTLNIFRQHVDDFEAKHIGESSSSGICFPDQITNVLLE